MSPKPTPTHSVFDSDSLIRQAIGRVKEERQQRVVDAARALQRTSTYLEEHNMSNLEHQEGKRMPRIEFEARVQKLIPNLVFRTENLTTDKASFLEIDPGIRIRQMLLRLPDGNLRYIASYQDLPTLPEFTVIMVRRKKTVALDAKGLPVSNVSARDLPKSRQDADGNWTWDGPTPLDSYVNEPTGTIPGWRSALTLMILGGLVSTAAVEAEFGGADRETWAGKTGKQRVFTEV